MHHDRPADDAAPGRAGSPHPFRVYAHRGASAELPENTLEAFARAVELGVDALELDVWLTADGAVVVHHDALGARTADVDAHIARAPLADVRAWDVGHAFRAPDGSRPFVGRGFRAPLLEEVLEAFPGVHVNVDVKHHHPRAAEAVVRLCERLRVEGRVTLTSVDHGLVIGMRKLGWRGALGMGQRAGLSLVALPAFALRHLPRVSDAVQIPHRYAGVRFARRAIVDRCHALGLRVDYWTVNDPALAAELIALGADGIMTDDPARVVAAAHAARRGA
ncbi:MAG: glycerophosphodiester phosphodiesterase [Deltaproteobacteria bacterium]|nr:glycerophosphodiester phosphodiesterase [Deltaproteobacteria bacterium]